MKAAPNSTILLAAPPNSSGGSTWFKTQRKVAGGEGTDAVVPGGTAILVDANGKVITLAQGANGNGTTALVLPNKVSTSSLVVEKKAY